MLRATLLSFKMRYMEGGPGGPRAPSPPHDPWPQKVTPYGSRDGALQGCCGALQGCCSTLACRLFVWLLGGFHGDQ